MSVLSIFKKKKAEAKPVPKSQEEIFQDILAGRTAGGEKERQKWEEKKRAGEIALVKERAQKKPEAIKMTREEAEERRRKKFLARLGGQK